MTNETKHTGHSGAATAEPPKPAIQEYPKQLSKPKPLKTDPLEYETVIVTSKKEEEEKTAEGFLDAEKRAKHDQEHAKAEEAKAKK